MYCSTFAYKWDDGTISGAVTGLRKGDEDIVVRLEPVSSNEDYEDDLEDDLQVKYSPSGTTYAFQNVADGRYRVILEAEGGFKGDTVSAFSVVHDETAAERNGSHHARGKNLSATDLRGVIKGVIGNNISGTALAGNEARAGVVVGLVNANQSLTTAKWSEGAAVNDENGDPRTAETDEYGVYVFEGVEMGKNYFVKPVSTDLYVSVRNGSTTNSEKATDVVERARVAPVAMPADEIIDLGVPEWDIHTSTISGHMGGDFALLYMDGEIAGEVEDPGAGKGHQHTTVELNRCLTSDQVRNDEGTVTTEATGCSTYATGGGSTTEVSANGSWFASNLREGVYEVDLDLPAGYVTVTVDVGNAATVAAAERKVVELEGGRSSEELDKFNIMDRNANAETVIETDTVRIGTTTRVALGTGGGTGTRTSAPEDAFVTYDQASVNLGLAPGLDSRGATFMITDGVATTPRRFTSGGSWRLEPGPNAIAISVAAQNGYGAAGTYPSNATTEGDLHRDRDTRMSAMSLQWQGGQHSRTRAELLLIAAFETDEARQYRRIAGGEEQPTTVKLGSFAVPFGAQNITVNGRAMDAAASGDAVGVTVAYSIAAVTGSPSISGGVITIAGGEVADVTITITDDGRGENARTYELRVSMPAS
jgi:hypothetical protein